MRRIAVFVLLALGAALLSVGVVTTVWATDVVKKTPIDVDSTTVLEGEAARLGGETQPIRITRLTQADSDASNDDRAVFVSVQCVVFTDEGDVPTCGDQSEATDQPGGDPRVLSISVDKFVTDRVTALAISSEGIVPEADRGAQREGLLNKFPFDTEKKSYPYWDDVTAQTWPAEFVEEEVVDGMDTYLFRVTIDSDDAEVAPGTRGGYTNTVDLNVEPDTGAIVRQSLDQTRTVGGQEVLTLTAAFTDEQVAASVDAAEDRQTLVRLVSRTLPLVGFIGGAVLLLAGAGLALTGRRRRD